jgi:hypothetical protein
VSAAALSEADMCDVRQVVEAQLKAFAQGDASRAYSYASPEIQARFGDANNFMAMVRLCRSRSRHPGSRRWMAAWTGTRRAMLTYRPRRSSQRSCVHSCGSSRRLKSWSTAEHNASEVFDHRPTSTFQALLAMLSASTASWRRCGRCLPRPPRSAELGLQQRLDRHPVSRSHVRVVGSHSGDTLQVGRCRTSNLSRPAACSQ